MTGAEHNSEFGAVKASPTWLPSPQPWCACCDPDSKVHGSNMGPIWGREDPGGPHVGPMNFAIWGGFEYNVIKISLKFIPRSPIESKSALM